jgi:hypothetical protein
MFASSRARSLVSGSALLRGIRRGIFTADTTRVDQILLMKMQRPLSEEEVSEAMSRLSSIPGVVGVSMGAAHNATADGYTHGAVVRFADVASLEAYATHPEHVYVRDAILAPTLAKTVEPPSSSVAMEFTTTHVAYLKPAPALAIGAVLGVIAGAIAGRLSVPHDQARDDATHDAATARRAS